ncbi:protein FAM184A isoform X5 [Anabrus simplex]
MEQLTRDVTAKACSMDRLQAELAGAHKESELMRQKLRQLEDDLCGFKRCNADLAQQLQAQTEALQAQTESLQTQTDFPTEDYGELKQKVEEMAAHVASLEQQLAVVQKERDQLQKARAEMEAEREEEMKIVQEALEEAQAEKMEIQARFEQDFERLRTVNTDREQQLLDDFEWKLREVEQSCKRRLEEREKATEARVQEVRRELENRLVTAETELAEAKQLRTLTFEQKRSLRAATRQMEEFQVSERILKEEIAQLKSAVESEKSYASTIQRNYDRHVSEAERKLQTKLNEQRNEITAEWEERLRTEISRLRTELQQLHTEELLQAVRAARQEQDHENQAKQASIEKRLQDCLKEVSKLKAELNEKDAQHQRDLENAQTNADRDIMDWRRKLDKLDMSYQEQIERLQENHEKEIERLTEDAERRVQQAEQAWQLQATSTRATLELVKEQLERDAQDRLDALERKHQEQLGTLNGMSTELQWERLMQEREEVLAVVQQQHQEQLDALKRELEAAQKEQKFKESELHQLVTGLRDQLVESKSETNNMQNNLELLQGGVQVLSSELNNQTRHLLKTQERFREREAQMAAEHQRVLDEVNAKHAKELQAVQLQTQARIVELTTRLEQASKEPREEDLHLIVELQQGIAVRENELAKLTEEKQYYQQELANKKIKSNQTTDVEPVVVPIDPQQHRHRPRKGGGNKSVPPPILQVNNQPRRTHSAPR